MSLTACPGWWQWDHGHEPGPVAGSGGTGGAPAEPAADGGEPMTCGGFAGPCDDANDYCNFPESANCGRADATGLCEPKPTGCTKEYRPVCGCNGRTYGNACTAAAAGVSVDAQGECENETCGGFAGLTCPEGEYCNLAEGQGCEVADASGICRPRPENCTDEYKPVCGCDGKTYGNACEAAAAGVSVAAEGECG